MDTVASSSGATTTAVYDGFISYSHAADDQLAPRLQAGLQKFAKPWWKRRATRIFRDEASLSANPHLWSSITEALEGAEWFILLLSSEAAQSEWVNKEIEYWLEHKDAAKVIPVVTDGEFAWSGTDVEPGSTAAPPALYGAFAEEPRWVDLRWARNADQLDLNNPDFSAAVADIASAIRGVPKDELASEEVRQHRRTVRTAWGAAFALLLLTLLAGGAALYANAQRNEADDQRSAAEASAQAEAAAAAEAEVQRAEAEAQTVIAEENADLARSRELAASAIGVSDRDPELSLLLTMAAFGAAPQGAAFPEGTIALRQALDEHSLLERFSVGTNITDVALSADGSRLVASSFSDRSVTMLDVATGEAIWKFVDADTVDQYWQLAMSPDESTIVAYVNNDRIPGDFSDIGIAEGEQDGLPARLVVLDATEGSVIRTIPFETCDWPTRVGPGFSPDGRYLQVTTGDPCDTGDLTTEFVGLYDTDTWEEVQRFHRDAFLTSVFFSEDMSRIVVRADGESTELRSWPDLDLIQEFPPSHTAALSPDGTLLALGASTAGRAGATLDFRIPLYDTASGDLVDVFSGPTDFHNAGVLFSEDGSQLYLGTAGTDVVWDASTGDVLHRLHSGESAGLSASADGSLLATARQNGEILLWDLASRSSAHPLELIDAFPVWINANQILKEGDATALDVLSIADDGTEEGAFGESIVLIDPATGAVLSEIRAVGAAPLPDGRFIVMPDVTDPVGASVYGPLSVWDPTDGSLEALNDCVVGADVWVSNFETFTCPDGSPILGDYMITSEDGATVAIGAQRAYFEPTGTVVLWDAQTLEPTSEFTTGERLDFWDTLTDTWFLAEGLDSLTRVVDPRTGDLITTLAPGEVFRQSNGAVTPDGSTVFLSSGSDFGRVWVFSTTTWEADSWQAHEEGVRGFALSPDGSMLATTGEDDFVKIWSLPDRILLDKIPADFPSDATWIDDDTLGIALADGVRWAVVTLNVNELLAQARDTVTRTFTSEECTLYGIDPCPTLEEIKSA